MHTKNVNTNWYKKQLPRLLIYWLAMTFVHLTRISTTLSFMGARPRLAGVGGGGSCRSGRGVPYTRGGVVARKFWIKRLKETILQQSKTLTVLEKDGIYFLFINTSLRTTLNDCFMGKKICFPPWTWNQKLQFTSLSTLRRERSRVLQGLDSSWNLGILQNLLFFNSWTCLPKQKK